MKTEKIQRQPRRQDPHALSRALQELAPRSCKIVDSRGKPVPLSGAGYVLRFGHSYRVRVIPPFKDEELLEVRIINKPSFLTLDPELKEVDGQGRAVRSIPFKVQFDLLAHVRKFGLDMRCDELEVAHYFRSGQDREAPIFLCPIVVRPRWMIALTAVLLGLVFYLVEHLVFAPFAEDKTAREAVQGLVQSLLTRADSWLWFLAITAVTWIGVNLISMARLYQRSRELRARFREWYPA